MLSETCIFCGTTFQVPENRAGKTVRCPKCNRPIGIPSHETDKAPSDALRARASDFTAEALGGPLDRAGRSLETLSWVCLVAFLLAGAGMFAVGLAHLVRGRAEMNSVLPSCVLMSGGLACIAAGGILWAAGRLLCALARSMETIQENSVVSSTAVARIYRMLRKKKDRMKREQEAGEKNPAEDHDAADTEAPWSEFSA